MWRHPDVTHYSFRFYFILLYLVTLRLRALILTNNFLKIICSSANSSVQFLAKPTRRRWCGLFSFWWILRSSLEYLAALSEFPVKWNYLELFCQGEGCLVWITGFECRVEHLQLSFQNFFRHVLKLRPHTPAKSCCLLDSSCAFSAPAKVKLVSVVQLPWYIFLPSFTQSINRWTNAIGF